MATKKLGNLIREARTGAGLTQEQLAKKVTGISALDISKAERGQKDLTQAQLKAIAKATGVTQTSLLEAAKTSTTTKTSSAGSTVKVTAAEKKMLDAYRKADADTKKAALSLLKGEMTNTQAIIGELLGNAVELLGK